MRPALTLALKIHRELHGVVIAPMDDSPNGTFFPRGT